MNPYILNIQNFLRYTASKVETLRLKSTKKITTSYVIKSFVSDMGDKLPVITELLLFSICFLISEAIVESWESSLNAVYKKHNTRDLIDDLKDPGTVDMLTFV